jgi:ATP/maltotriose-dependent transcriptional regulator MalT
MSEPLVATKLLRPRLRRDRVPRPRLAGLLTQAADAPLTVVSAPAGFGKTTLVAAWTADLARPVAWVSLDERDRHPSWFWSYFLAALERALPGSAGASLTLWQSGQAPIEVVLGGLVNELSVHAGEVTVVLDDYHLADGPDVAAGMTTLVELLPPQLHLVISTRVDPGLPLPRLRAGGELVEVRAAQLRFDSEEVSAYLNDLNDLALPTDAVAALEARTEGWVAALQLAVLSLRGRADAAAFIDRFTGDDRYVVDYLVEEVLDRQPEHVRRFLLDTSILGRLTAPLCQAVHGDPAGDTSGAGSARDMLDLLERQNLFVIALDDQRRWYRYHHLFADVLRAYLTRERPGDVTGLHYRASRWYAENGDIGEAVRHSLASGDTAAAAQLIEQALPQLKRDRRERLLRHWVDDLPDAAVHDRPVLAIGLVGGLMASNEFDDIERRLRQVEKMLTRPARDLAFLDEDALARVPAEVEMYRAALALVAGDPTSAIDRARRAVAAAPEGDDLTPASAAAIAGLASWASGDIVTGRDAYLGSAAALTRAGHIADVLGCALAIADMELALGRLRGAEHTLHDALQLAEQSRGDGSTASGSEPDTALGSELGTELGTASGTVLGTASGGRTPLRGTADMLVALSRVAWHRDDLAAAADLLRRADDLGEPAGLPQNPYRWRVAMARLRAAEGDWVTALDLLEEAERVYVGDFSPPVHPIHASRARVLTASGDLAAAAAWARDHDLRADDDLTYLHEYEHVTLARLLLAENQRGYSATALRDAIALLDRLLAAADAGARAGSVIEIEVLRSGAHQASGNMHTALSALEHAVDLAEPEQWMRFLIDADPALHDVLTALAARRPGSPYVGTLLTRGGQEPSAPSRAPSSTRSTSPQSALLDPLSDRELDVLRLLASDLDGPAIARELIVSLNTVRTHTKRIYTKLAVNNRRAAISKAHQLGLLSRAGRP